MYPLKSVMLGSVGAASVGTYKLKELAKYRALSCIRVQVLFLDDTAQVFELEKKAKGESLINLVFNHLELIERDYFGLQYSASEYHQQQWFWVTDPGKLVEEYTRYQLVLQLRRDIINGRLAIPSSISALLASYVLQAEIGDHCPGDQRTRYINHIKLVPNQTPDMERKIIELHKLHKGQTPSDAEYNFLDHAKRLDLYGIDVHKVRDSTNRELDIGVMSSGLVVLQNGIKINTFSWAKIIKVSFKRKQFFIQLHREVTSEVESKSCDLTPTSNTRWLLLRRLYRKSENYDSVLGFNLTSYRACKSLWKSCVEHHTFFRLHTPKPTGRKSALSLGSKFRYSGKTEYQTVEEGKWRRTPGRAFIRSPSKQFVSQSLPVLGEQPYSGLMKAPPTGTVRPRSDSQSGYKVTIYPGAKMPKMAWIDMDEPRLNGSFVVSEENGLVAEEREIMLPTTLPSPSDESSSSQLDTTLSQALNGSAAGGDDGGLGLVSIRMRPNEDGKYGFNVKGGVDERQPILVSRVAPGTPADRCYPRLNEGDQVLFINGCDIAAMTHFEVVNIIKSSKELLLTVKQNVYEPDGLDEPPFQYVPEILPEGLSMLGLSGRGGALDESLLLLSEGLESGSLVAQFEQLYRRKPGLAVNEARKPDNEKKNRYRDISPYDTTRIVLKYSPTGDYINASLVNMDIPGSGIINRYIATQGPLGVTSGDFWRMVWEQQSNLVVMLTTVVEQGRIKCHKYWPKLSESAEFGGMKIFCSKETETPGFSFREFVLTNTQTLEDRHVTHMQYLAWPDHGVPDDSTEFLNFATKVRRARIGMVEPTIVHCSAGIGRTGVLILMETAQCLIEANQPVYPLDIVRTMRDQRAMMIQTASQYRFVCEAIQRVYQERLIQPLPEYQQR